MSLATGTAPEYVAGQFPPFAVTVDLVVLTVREGALSALLIRRGEQPHLGRSALPGGFVRIDEDLDVAARRELFEETGLARLPVHLEQLATYGAVGRDPRMRVVSVAYLALAPDLPAPQAGGDAACAGWVPVAEVLPELFPAQPGSGSDDAARAEARGIGLPSPGGTADSGTGAGAGAGAAASATVAAATGGRAATSGSAGSSVGAGAGSSASAGAGPSTGAGAASSAAAANSTANSATSTIANSSANTAATTTAATAARTNAAPGADRDGQPVLAFDHVGILTDGVERARAKLEYSPLAAAFCPPEFTVGELRRVYEAVWGVTLDARNFHRKVTGTSGFLLPVGRATVRQGGRPAQLFQRGPATLLNPPMLRPV